MALTTMAARATSQLKEDKELSDMGKNPTKLIIGSKPDRQREKMNEMNVYLTKDGRRSSLSGIYFFGHLFQQDVHLWSRDC